MTIVIVIVLICLTGFFDSTMDSIKDFGQNYKFWLWKLCRGTRYETWCLYGSHVPLPFFKKYDPGKIWASDSWHMAKHFMLLSWSGAVSILLPFGWFNVLPFVGIYYLEGLIFRLMYEPLKEK